MSKKLTAKSIDALLKRTRKEPAPTKSSSSLSTATASTAKKHKQPFTRQNTYKKRQPAKQVSQLPQEEAATIDPAERLERNLAFFKAVKTSEKEKSLKMEVLKKA
ncbi:hypothetical protein HK097_008560 [Rhizophlyctis rosea]|uniref:Uncharacterized protein n=1 Tax=Rhizophlyctis rosea TaxID=64517 RepID=A0AAD5SCE3_9FUNG|nr:hypothetical protein HK097_008560 [Rhizophlyctis rosea]